MRSTRQVLLLAAVAASVAVMSAAPACAQESHRSPAVRSSAHGLPAAEASSQMRRRPATRLRVYRQNLPPSAVRTCDAWYVQEFRPSGTVIVPRMRCRWVAG